jgi:homeobox protein DLX2
MKTADCGKDFLMKFIVAFAGLSPPSSQTAAPWEQKPPPSHWNGPPNNGMGPAPGIPQLDHKPPQMAPQTHVPPQPTHAPQMGGYMPQYWYQPETNPSLLT